MTEFFQQVLDGLSSGLVYGMLALALSVVFQGTGMLNFAQGEMATLSAFVTLVLLLVGMQFLGGAARHRSRCRRSVAPSSSEAWSAASRALANCRC